MIFAPLPARPVNGGRFDLAPVKIGKWSYSSKLNGYRVLIHLPTMTLFNRHQTKLDAKLTPSFAVAIKLVEGIREKLLEFTDWLDAEALERRHTIAQGTLVILDYIPRGLDRSKTTYEARRERILSFALPLTPLDPKAWSKDSLYVVADTLDSGLYGRLRQYNEAGSLNGAFYEGVVAKLVSSTYPVNGKDCPYWVKHKFDDSQLGGKR